LRLEDGVGARERDGARGVRSAKTQQETSTLGGTASSTVKRGLQDSFERRGKSVEKKNRVEGGKARPGGRLPNLNWRSSGRPHVGWGTSAEAAQYAKQSGRKVEIVAPKTAVAQSKKKTKMEKGKKKKRCETCNWTGQHNHPRTEVPTPEARAYPLVNGLARRATPVMDSSRSGFKNKQVVAGAPKNKRKFLHWAKNFLKKNSLRGQGMHLRSETGGHKKKGGLAVR